LASQAGSGHDGLDHQSDDHKVRDHLKGDQQACALGSRGDVPEPDRREDGDGEVQRVGMREGLAEAGAGHPGRDDIAASEEQQEQRDVGGERFDRPQGWVR
jgi:hypothetical protein